MPRLVAQPGGLSESVQWAENSESTKDSGPAQGTPGSLNRRVGEKSFLFQPRSLSQFVFPFQTACRETESEDGNSRALTDKMFLTKET